MTDSTGTGPSARPGSAPALTVIIVSWNTRDLLRRCLEGVARQAGDLAHEVVVVDNASTDGSADMVAERFPHARLVRNPDNRGFGAACNQGAALAGGRHLLFLNPDAEPTPGALQGLVAYLDAHPEVAIAGPLIVGDDGRTPGLTYGYYPSVATALVPLLGPLIRSLPGRHDAHELGVVPRRMDPSGAPRDVDYVCGAALAVRHDAFRALGGFDEAFFLYFEETDLCRRAVSAGHRVVVHPALRVIHQEGASRDKRSGPAVAHYYRSLDRYLAKHHGGASGGRIRGALWLSLMARYLVARLGIRRSRAGYYRDSARALRARGDT